MMSFSLSPLSLAPLLLPAVPCGPGSDCLEGAGVPAAGRASRPDLGSFRRLLGRLLAVALLGLLAAACGTTSKPTGSLSTGTKIGKPYQINGVWYHPREQWDYDEIGTASWYGPGFHGKRTANGERFNQNAMTAAHPTLPMPTMVEVTNLANGRTITVRINDRGPFAQGRIIDLSRKAAEQLGFRQQGVARVRVRLVDGAIMADLRREAVEARSMVEPIRRPEHPDPIGEKIVASLNAQSPAGQTANGPQPGSDPQTRETIRPDVIPQRVVRADPAVHAQTQVTLPDADLPAAPAPIPTPAPTPTPGAPAPRAPDVASQSQDRRGTGQGVPEPALRTVSLGPEPDLAIRYLQLGAFRVESNAVSIVQKASGGLPEGVSAFISTIQAGAAPLYRVRVGPLRYGPNLESVVAQMARLGYDDVAILSDSCQPGGQVGGGICGN